MERSHSRQECYRGSAGPGRGAVAAIQVPEAARPVRGRIPVGAHPRDGRIAIDHLLTAIIGSCDLPPKGMPELDRLREEAQGIGAAARKVAP